MSQHIGVSPTAAVGASFGRTTAFFRYHFAPLHAIGGSNFPPLPLPTTNQITAGITRRYRNES